MTFIKRLITAIFVFLPLLVFLYFGICLVGGGLAGVRSAADHPRAKNQTELGAAAGADFVKDNLANILLGAGAGSLLISFALSFSGVFPWCRRTA
jgi:hypothetical protein